MKDHYKGGVLETAFTHKEVVARLEAISEKGDTHESK